MHHCSLGTQVVLIGKLFIDNELTLNIYKTDNLLEVSRCHYESGEQSDKQRLGHANFNRVQLTTDDAVPFSVVKMYFIHEVRAVIVRKL